MGVSVVTPPAGTPKRMPVGRYILALNYLMNAAAITQAGAGTPRDADATAADIFTSAGVR